MISISSEDWPQRFRDTGDQVDFAVCKGMMLQLEIQAKAFEIYPNLAMAGNGSI
jgi:hypothetical protein